MKSKWTLFAGILFLVAGIVLRNITEFELVPLSLIVLGVLFKTYYLVGMAKRGQYKPGYELYFLFAGLALFLSGLYLKLQDPSGFSRSLIITGILLKIAFIVIFIVRIKAAGNQK